MRKDINISYIVCVMILMLGGGGCSTESPNHCESNDICVPEASCRADTGRCEFWESLLTASRNGDWKDATIGNPYEVEYVASGGFPPYTWILNDGQTVSHLEWLTLVAEGDNSEKAKLQNKAGQLPLLGDINVSGIPIKITVFDNTKRGDADRLDNNGVTINETLKINGCPDNNCAVCSSKQQQFCDIADFGTANCNLDTNKIRKCWADSDGCFVWQDQTKDCTGNETCTVALSDGSVTCACLTGFEGDTCDRCAWGFLEYPSCHVPNAGYAQDVVIAGVSFKMNYVPGGIFPTGTNDLGGNQTVSAFWIGETEVTYELWNAVYTWATSNGYTFANMGTIGSGGSGSQQQPVTHINWRDAMVWCNAASEAAGLTPVYYSDAGYTTPIRSVDNSTIVDTVAGHEDNPYLKTDANGFRLPNSMEWECAARYRGADTTNSINVGGIYWTKGNSASGAYTFHNDSANVNPPNGYPDGKDANDLVAVYKFYWNGSKYVDTGRTATEAVKSKAANTLGLYDMSGNVDEWCFDWHPGQVGSNRMVRGGSWVIFTIVLQVGYSSYPNPYFTHSGLGFRLVRTN